MLVNLFKEHLVLQGLLLPPHTDELMDNSRPGRLPETHVSRTGTGWVSVFPWSLGCPLCPVCRPKSRVCCPESQALLTQYSGQVTVFQGLTFPGRFLVPNLLPHFISRSTAFAGSPKTPQQLSTLAAVACKFDLCNKSGKHLWNNTAMHPSSD